ncbi:MAG: hypothetical protein IJY20_00990 [Clostridia bacterium]|nr:hypothetical protein [Clostridia bacterium]
MAFTLLSVVMILIFATAAFIEIFRAHRRGLLKSLLTFGTVVLSVVMSLALTPLLSRPISLIVFHSIRRQSFYRAAFREYEFIDSFIEACICIAIGAFLFVVLFFLMRMLIALVVKLVWRKVLPVGQEEEPEIKGAHWYERNSKQLAVLTGAICALIVTMVLTSPLMGILDVARTAVAIAEKTDEHVWRKSGVDEEEIEALNAYAMDIPGNVFYQCGGKYMFYAAATATVYGEKVSLPYELKQFEGVVEDFVAVAPAVNGERPATKVDVERIRSISNRVQEMRLGHILLAEYLPTAAEVWAEGKLYLGIGKPVVDDTFAPIVDLLLEECKETNVRRVQRDVATLLNTYAILIQHDFYVEEGSLRELLADIEESGIVDLLEEELLHNSNTAMLAGEVKQITLELVRDCIRETETGKELYQQLVENLADAVITIKNRDYSSTEEMLTAMTTYTERYFGEFGLELFDKAACYVAEQMVWAVDAVTVEDAVRQIDVILLNKLV